MHDQRSEFDDGPAGDATAIGPTPGQPPVAPPQTPPTMPPPVQEPPRPGTPEPDLPPADPPIEQPPGPDLPPAEPPNPELPPAPDLPPAARRALAEAQARRREPRAAMPLELGGRDGPEPVRFGDWEKKGIAYDF